MKQILNIYKPIAMTPYQLILRLKQQMPEYKDVTMGYAGRLDPLAHGVLLLMLDEANKQREKYIDLEKTYEFRVLFGVETDSFDALGMLQGRSGRLGRLGISGDLLETYIKTKVGRQVQVYPPFSSKTIDGVSLFKLAKRGKLEGKTIPTRDVTIHEFTPLEMEKLTSQELRAIIIPNLKKIKGYFRQQKIIKQWVEFFRVPSGTRQGKNEVFTTARFSISCTSGTYVRSLAHEMGQKFGCGAIALEILRTRVGEYNLNESLRLK